MIVLVPQIFWKSTSSSNSCKNLPNFLKEYLGDVEAKLAKFCKTRSTLSNFFSRICEARFSKKSVEQMNHNERIMKQSCSTEDDIVPPFAWTMIIFDYLLSGLREERQEYSKKETQNIQTSSDWQLATSWIFSLS